MRKRTISLASEKQWLSNDAASRWLERNEKKPAKGKGKRK